MTIQKVQESHCGPITCHRCQGNHLATVCRFRFVHCRSCGEKGHIVKHASLNQHLLRGQGEGKLIKFQHIRSLWVKRPLLYVPPHQRSKTMKPTPCFQWLGKPDPLLLQCLSTASPPVCYIACHCVGRWSKPFRT